jgi:hypothetical protein
VIGRWTVVNGLLLAIVALLGVQIARTWMRAVPPLRVPSGVAEERSRRDAKGKPAVVPRGEQTSEMVATITNLDLFDQSRQALGTATAAAVVEVPPPTGIELVGVRLLGGDEEAFIRDASQQNAQRRVRTGDEVAGYTVQTINPTNVELGNANGQTVTLWLQLTPSAAVKPAQGVPAPRPGGAPVAPPRPAAAVAQPPAVSVPPLDPTAAERQRRRQERLQNRGVVAPSLPPGVRQQRDQMQNKGT